MLGRGTFLGLFIINQTHTLWSEIAKWMEQKDEHHDKYRAARPTGQPNAGSCSTFCVYSQSHTHSVTTQIAWIKLCKSGTKLRTRMGLVQIMTGKTCSNPLKVILFSKCELISPLTECTWTEVQVTRRQGLDKKWSVVFQIWGSPLRSKMQPCPLWACQWRSTWFDKRRFGLTLNGALKEGLASLAGWDTIMKSRGYIPTYQANPLRAILVLYRILTRKRNS